MSSRSRRTRTVYTGTGCATFTQRADLIKPAVERYLKPLLIDHAVDKIEDIWQTCYDISIGKMDRY